MKDLTKGNERRVVFYFALPMLIGNVFQQLHNIINSIIVGKLLGKEALAAVGATFPYVFLLIALIIGVSSGITIVIAQYYGAKDMLKVKKAVDTMYIFLFFASIFISLIGIIFTVPVFKLIELPENILILARNYMYILLSGMIFTFGYNGIAAVLRGLGDSKTPLYFLIISTVINIILDFVFIMIFKTGVEGAALATIISQAIAFFSGWYYLSKKENIGKISIKQITFDKDIFWISFRVGLPSGFQQTFVAMGMLALMGIVSNFGTEVIAAYSVVGRIDSFAGMPAMNFSFALATFVGQNIGAGMFDRAKKGMYETLKMTSLISVIITLIMLLWGRNVMRIFTDDVNVINIGYNYLIIVSSFYIVFSSMFVLNGILRGAGDTLIPMLITLFSLWIVRIPLSYFLSKGYGVSGIWWGIPAAWITGTLFSLLYYKSGKWKNKVIVEKTPLSENKFINPPEV